MYKENGEFTNWIIKCAKWSKFNQNNETYLRLRYLLCVKTGKYYVIIDIMWYLEEIKLWYLYEDRITTSADDNRYIDIMTVDKNNIILFLAQLYEKMSVRN